MPLNTYKKSEWKNVKGKLSHVAAAILVNIDSKFVLTICTDCEALNVVVFFTASKCPMGPVVLNSYAYALHGLFTLTPVIKGIKTYSINVEEKASV